MSSTSPQQPAPQPSWGAPAPQPKKRTGRNIALGCGGALIGGLLLLGGCAALVASSSDDGSTSNKGYKPEKTGEPKDESKSKTDQKAKPKTVVFKVWGKGANGVDINYGSDNDSRKGTFKSGKFEATLPLNKDAMFYHVMGQLQGGGDIQCSVTIGGKTRTGHAAGDYNICDAQLNADFTGGWD